MDEKVPCSFCGQLTERGLRIHGAVICPACEGRLARVTVKDEDYPQWLAAFRTLWHDWLKGR